MNGNGVHVANTSDLRDGQMKEVSIGETRILLARVNNRFHAVSATCPHYGAPLAEGVLCGTRIVCPWHHAVFNVVNGGLEEPPALDGLTRYDVHVEGERIMVDIAEPAPTQSTAKEFDHNRTLRNRRRLKAPQKSLITTATVIRASL
jgi:apoptosis-inducing factor 3